MFILNLLENELIHANANEMSSNVLLCEEAEGHNGCRSNDGWI